MKAWVHPPKGVEKEWERERIRYEKKVMADLDKKLEEQTDQVTQRVLNMALLAMAKGTRCKPVTAQKMIDCFWAEVWPRWEYLAEQKDDDGNTCCDAWAEMELDKLGFPCFRIRDGEI